MTDKTLPPLPEHWMTAELRDMPAAYQRAAREYAEDYARAAFAAQKPLHSACTYPRCTQSTATGCTGPCRTGAAQKPQAEPVAWCELTQSGKIAYFDGRPMIMLGPVGNEHHQTPLYAAAPPAENPVEAGHRRATPEESAAVDDALGLVLLPPIRITQRAHAVLSRIAEARGLVLQAVVREALEPGETMGAAEAPVAWMYDRVGGTFNPEFIIDGPIADALRCGISGPLAVVTAPDSSRANWRPLYAAAQPQKAPQPLTQRQIDDVLNASREADEGPTQLIRRVERVLGIGTKTGESAL